MIEAAGVTLEIGGKALVDSVDFEIAPGRLTVLIGPNGAGKTSLLRLLTGERAPTRGSVRIDGRPLTALEPWQLAARRAVVPQASSLPFAFRVLDVVLLGATVPGFVGAAPRHERAARDALAAVDLAGFEERWYAELSGGERQRVQVARALCQIATAPPAAAGVTRALLLDEPTSSLDITHQEVVLGEVRRQRDRGLAVLVILHDLNMASAFADEIVLMRDGRSIATGPPATVLRDELLGATYGGAIRVGATPPAGRPFVLPAALVSQPPSA